MKEPLDEAYLTWLYLQTGPILKNPERTYWSLLRQLYTKEYVWIVPNDDNRVADGQDLRYEFLESNEYSDAEVSDWLNLGCSFLEMLIGLSRRLSFEAEGEPRMWFWRLLENLGLDECNDKSHYKPEGVDEILEYNIWRTYKRDGRGGLFPLREAKKDQRDVEIWYQMAAYLIEDEEE